MEAFEQAPAALVDLTQQGFARLRKGLFDGAALGVQRGGDAVAGLRQHFRHLAGRRVEFAGDGGMGAGKGFRNLVGVGDDGFALARQFIEQDADAALVVAIGALKLGHLGADHAFQLAGAGQRPFDAVAHGRDLAADRLAQGHNLFSGDGFGLGETNRHLGHGAGGVAHFLGAAQNGAHGEEENDRRDQGEGRDRRARSEQRASEGLAMGEDEMADPQPDPGGRADDRYGHGAGVGTALQRLQDLADRRQVVIGRARARRRARRLGMSGSWRKFVRRDFGHARGGLHIFEARVGARGRKMEVQLGGLLGRFRFGRGRRRGLRLEIEPERVLDRRQSGGRGILSLARCGHIEIAFTTDTTAWGAKTRAW